ncbi:MAG: hypothetical protein ACKVIH_04120 [Burkholderiales bacterium]
MPRLIAFVVCIALLFWGGGFVKIGMALVALAFLLLVGMLAWYVVSTFTGPLDGK